MQTAIIGLGYVGLPLSLQFARSGVEVLGLDVDSSKIDALDAGRSYIHHIPDEEIAKLVSEGHFSATTDFSRVAEVDAVIICVPTPLNSNREPDISYVLKSGEAFAPYLRKGTVVVLESTTYPGTTDEDLRTVIEAGSGLVAGPSHNEEGRQHAGRFGIGAHFCCHPPPQMPCTHLCEGKKQRTVRPEIDKVH